MKNVPITDISYITNGSAISADVLNGPSVGLMQNVTAIALAAETFSEEILTTSNLAASLVIDSSIDTADLQGNISPGIISAVMVEHVNGSNYTDKFYAIKLDGRADSSTGSSQIEIYSGTENKARYVIKSSQVSSYYSGYSNIQKSRMLKNNGDSLALKIARQNTATSTGLNTVAQPSSLNVFTNSGTGNADILYTAATQSGISLCKLPILDRVTLASTMTIGDLRGYFSSATQNQYVMYFNVAGGVTFRTNNQASEVVAARLYVTVPDHSDKSKILTLKLRNDEADVTSFSQITDLTDIHWFTVDTDHAGAPWDYTNDNGSAKTINIYFKLDSASSYTQIYTSEESAFVPTQNLPDNYVYIPLATKVSSGIKFIDNIAPELLVSDTHFSAANSTASSSKLFDMAYLRSINNQVVRIASVVKTGETFGRIICPEQIARYIRHCISLSDTVYIKLLNLTVDTIKKPALNSGVDPSTLQIIRTRSAVDGNNTFPGISVFRDNLGSTAPMSVATPASGSRADILALDPSPSNLSAYSISSAFTLVASTGAEMTSNGNIALLTYELTDNNTANISPKPAPGSGASQMSRNIDITSSYKLIITADVLFSFSNLS